MSFFGCDRPRIHKLSADNPANLKEVLDLPDPAEIIPQHERIFYEVKTARGKIHRQRLGWRYKVTLMWTNIGDSDLLKLTKIANWPGGLLLMPHIDHSLIGFNVEVDSFKFGHPKNRVVGIDWASITLISVDVLPIRDYDNLLNAQEGYYCNDNSIPTGSELLLNNDFADWSGDDPVDWEVVNEDVNNFVTESLVGESARMVSDEGNIYIKQSSLMVIGEVYLFTVEITEVMYGKIKIYDGANSYTVPGVVGAHVIRFEAAGEDFSIRRYSACDITFDNVSLKLAVDADLRLTFDEIIYS